MSGETITTIAIGEALLTKPYAGSCQIHSQIALDDPFRTPVFCRSSVIWEMVLKPPPGINFGILILILLLKFSFAHM